MMSTKLKMILMAPLFMLFSVFIVVPYMFIPTTKEFMQYLRSNRIHLNRGR